MEETTGAHEKEITSLTRRGGNRAGWAGSIVGRVKIDMVFLDQDFNISVRPKNRADRAR